MTSENGEVMKKFDNCTVILLDVAGTTTSNTFVKETLFKYAKEEAPVFLKEKWDDEEVKAATKLLQEDNLEIDRAIETFKKLTEENSDNKGVKSLQALIYKRGYENGTLKAHVFDDVPKALEEWSKDRKVAIYSTGSIDAQKLLFAHSSEGDISTNISDYFDQSVGLKTSSDSYTKILEHFKVEGGEMLFISDEIDELKSAKQAGLKTALIMREKNTEISEEIFKEHIVITSFSEVSFDSSNKRKNEDNTDVLQEPPTKIAKTDDDKNEIVNSTIEGEKNVENEPVATATKMEISEVESMDVDITEPATKEVIGEPENIDKVETIEEPEKPKDIPSKDTPSEIPSNDIVEDDTIKENTQPLPKDKSMEKPEEVINIEEAQNNSEKAPEVKTMETEKIEGKEDIEVDQNGLKDYIEITETAQSEECTKTVDDQTEAGENKKSETAPETVKEPLQNCESSVAIQEATETNNEAKTEESIETAKTESIKESEVNKTEIVDTKENVEVKIVSETTSDVNEETKKETESKVEAAPQTEECSIKESVEETKEKELEVVDDSKKPVQIESDVDSSTEKPTEICKTDMTVENDEVIATTEIETVKSDKVINEQNGTDKICEPSTTDDMATNKLNGQENGNNDKNLETDPEEETDIKIKKIETNEGSPAVSVEV